jgi:cytochrome c oxidase cbb3-type subunit 1
LCIFIVIRGYFSPEPTKESLAHYYDEPIKTGIVIVMLWAASGMFVRVWVSSLPAWPELTFDQAWASFGRLRLVHTTGVIFGFGDLALYDPSPSFPIVLNGYRSFKARMTSIGDGKDD